MLSIRDKPKASVGAMQPLSSQFDETENLGAKPFVKWVGGKRSLLDEPDTYHRLFDDTLNGLTGDNQVEGEAVGPNFWKVGAEGASGTYSSGAGQRVLRENIRSELQENLSEQLG